MLPNGIEFFVGDLPARFYSDMYRSKPRKNASAANSASIVPAPVLLLEHRLQQARAAGDGEDASTSIRIPFCATLSEEPHEQTRQGRCEHARSRHRP